MPLLAAICAAAVAAAKPAETHLKVKCSTRNECAAAATAAAPIFPRDVRGSVFHAHRGVRGAFDRLGAKYTSIAAPLARPFFALPLLAAIPRRAVPWVRMATIPQKHRATLLRARNPQVLDSASFGFF